MEVVPCIELPARSAVSVMQIRGCFDRSRRWTLCAAFSFLFLFSDAFPFSVFISRESAHFLDLFDELTAGKEAVDRLAPVLHAFYFRAGRRVPEVDAGRGFVDLLPALAGGAHEFFLDILFADIECLHLLLQPSVFFFAYCECLHGCSGLVLSCFSNYSRVGSPGSAANGQHLAGKW